MGPAESEQSDHTEPGERAPAPSGDTGARPSPGRRGPLRVLGRTLAKAWTDGIFGMSAQAAFWQTLSLPPLLLGLLGSLGYVAGWFGPNTVEVVEREILQFSSTIFTTSVVNGIIEPTVADILTRGRSSIVSVGFLLSLWAGSSALASLVDSITAAHGQHKVRNPIWQRIFALLLYLVTLVGAIFVLPLLAIGPDVLPELFPAALQGSVRDLVQVFYYPGLGVLLGLGLAALYKAVLPSKPPWHRCLPGALLAMLFFLVSSTILRRYIAWVTGTGYTYGALATPIAFLLFSFFIAFAIILGAQFNNALLENWPAHRTRSERRRGRRRAMARIRARALAEQGRSAWRRRSTPGPDDDPGDDPVRAAPSPADETTTVELSRNGKTRPEAAPPRAEPPRAELPRAELPAPAREDAVPPLP